MILDGFGCGKKGEEAANAILAANTPNLDKLFTPKFTTKSSGSGLGLAISRTVIERCRGEIRYSKSFSLGGACFTIYYPKSK